MNNNNIIESEVKAENNGKCPECGLSHILGSILLTTKIDRNTTKRIVKCRCKTVFAVTKTVGCVVYLNSSRN